MRRTDEISPLNQRFGLDAIIDGLACDLAELRQRKISVNDALARAALAKQIMNGIRLFVMARKAIEQDMSAPAIDAALQEGQ